MYLDTTNWNENIYIYIYILSGVGDMVCKSTISGVFIIYIRLSYISSIYIYMSMQFGYMCRLRDKILGHVTNWAPACVIYS